MNNQSAKITTNHLLILENISKSFYSVEVLHKVNFDLKQGEIHALMGENGAGKSTLVKILMGEHAPDNGTIFLNGQIIKIGSPSEALKYGISKVHQELSPILDMTISENIFLGREPKKYGFVDEKLQTQMTKELFNNLDLNLAPACLMRNLSIAEMQMVEIAKAVSYDSQILILDEPTSAITNTEIYKLFEILHVLKKKGIGVIYITHKLEEIYDIADRVTVLRDGAHITTENIKDIPKDKLIVAMVGRELKDLYPRTRNNIGNMMLSVRGIGRKHEFNNISFDIRSGEIVGLFGLMGSGRTEIFMSLFGANRLDEGDIYIKNEKIEINDPKEAILKKMALITEDRKLTGLNLLGSVQDNVMGVVQKRFSKFGIIDKRESKNATNEIVDSLKIKTQSTNQITSTLSGGNQQKVVLGKWQLSEPELIFFDEPTRGVDIGAKAEIYKIINDLAARGKAILMVSSEMPEIIGMCDRVLVIKHGELVGEFDQESFSQEAIMEMAVN